MLKNLVSRFRKEDNSHPLASDAGVEGILAEIPRNIPERTLFDLDHWLAESEHAGNQVEPARLQRSVAQLDEAAFPVVAECLDRYFDPHGRDHLSEQYWQTLLGHCQQAAAAHLRFLEKPPRPAAELTAADRKPMAPAAVRAMYWLMRGKALLRLRYRSPDAAWWRTVHDLLARAHAFGLGGSKLTPFKDMAAETSVWQEYSHGMYLELAPLGSLSPEQIETLDRVLRSFAGQLALKAAATPDSCAIDLTGTAGPVKAEPGKTEGPQWRYLNPAPVYGQLLRLASQVRGDKALPDWLAGAPASVADTEAMLKMLILHWSRQPPKRRGQRQARHDELLVVHGLGLARRMVACSDFARSGRSLAYDSDLAKAQRDRLESHFTTEGARQVAAAPAEAADPLEVLRKLELSGDRAMMEKWAVADVSGGGLGATIPHLRAVHRVGSLVGYRFANEIDWRLALIRRIGRDGRERTSVGLEALPGGPAACAQVKAASQAGKAAWHEIEGSGLGYLDAILASPEGDELILPAGAFAPNLAVALRIGGKDRTVVLAELLDKGKDFERVRFRTEN